MAKMRTLKTLRTDVKAEVNLPLILAIVPFYLAAYQADLIQSFKGEFAKTYANAYVLSEGIKDSRKDSMVSMNMILIFFAKI